MKAATFERNMALDIINFVLQSYSIRADAWKAKIVRENNDNELDPASGGASSAASLTQEACDGNLTSHGIARGADRTVAELPQSSAGDPRGRCRATRKSS